MTAAILKSLFYYIQFIKQFDNLAKMKKKENPHKHLAQESRKAINIYPDVRHLKTRNVNRVRVCRVTAKHQTQTVNLPLFTFVLVLDSCVCVCANLQTSQTSLFLLL